MGKIDHILPTLAQNLAKQDLRLVRKHLVRCESPYYRAQTHLALARRLKSKRDFRLAAELVLNTRSTDPNRTRLLQEVAEEACGTWSDPELAGRLVRGIRKRETRVLAWYRLARTGRPDFWSAAWEELRQIRSYGTLKDVFWDALDGYFFGDSTKGDPTTTKEECDFRFRLLDVFAALVAEDRKSDRVRITYRSTYEARKDLCGELCLVAVLGYEQSHPEEAGVYRNKLLAHFEGETSYFATDTLRRALGFERATA